MGLNQAHSLAWGIEISRTAPKPWYMASGVCGLPTTFSAELIRWLLPALSPNAAGAFLGGVAGGVQLASRLLASRARRYSALRASAAEAVMETCFHACELITVRAGMDGLAAPPVLPVGVVEAAESAVEGRVASAVLRLRGGGVRPAGVGHARLEESGCAEVGMKANAARVCAVSGESGGEDRDAVELECERSASGEGPNEGWCVRNPVGREGLDGGNLNVGREGDWGDTGVSGRCLVGSGGAALRTGDAFRGEMTSTSASASSPESSTSCSSSPVPSSSPAPSSYRSWPAARGLRQLSSSASVTGSPDGSRRPNEVSTLSAISGIDGRRRSGLDDTLPDILALGAIGGCAGRGSEADGWAKAAALARDGSAVGSEGEAGRGESGRNCCDCEPDREIDLNQLLVRLWDR